MEFEIQYYNNKLTNLNINCHSLLIIHTNILINVIESNGLQHTAPSKDVFQQV